MSEEPSHGNDAYHFLRKNHPDISLPDVRARIPTDTSLDMVLGGSVDTAASPSPMQEEHQHGGSTTNVVQNKGGPYDQQPAARFVVDGGDGISLLAAFREDTSGLEGEGNVPFEKINCDRPSLRINWPGYPPYSRQISFNDTNHTHPTTRGKLAKLVAKEVTRFIESNANVTGSDPEWRFDSNTVSMEMLFLREVRHVATSSLQPEFMLIRRNV